MRSNTLSPGRSSYVVAALLSTILAGCSSDESVGTGPVSPAKDASADSSVDVATDPAVDSKLETGVDEQAPIPDSSAGVDADAAEAAPEDPCPSLPPPASCFGRSVVYREWSPTATGDGAYFADQAPWRLGFNRLNDMVWIVKFRTEDNTYYGHIAAGGDSVGGIAWIASEPCDPSFAIDSSLVSWGAKGGGDLGFVVARNDGDAQKLHTDPTYSAYAKTPQLRGNHCYYVAFENAAEPPPLPLAPTWFTTVADSCGDPQGDPSCYYLAVDFGHLLHDPTLGTLFQSAVIAGLTTP